MKKQPFYKQGIGHPFKQTDDNNIIYTDQPLHISGSPLKTHHKRGEFESLQHQDPNRGERVVDADGNQTWTHFTDSLTGKQANINQNRTYKRAMEIDKEAKNVPENLDLARYTDYAIKSRKHFDDTGKWLKFSDFEDQQQTDKMARNDGGLNIESQEVPKITPRGVIKSELPPIHGSGGDPFSTGTSSNNSGTEEVVSSTGGDPGSNKATEGLVRNYESKKGFTGNVRDDYIAKNISGEQAIRRSARGAKETAMGAGATRREAKAHKQLWKATAYAQEAGLTLGERDAKGNVIRQSQGVKQGSNMSDGKARRKAIKHMKRYNRLQHRMKPHEGHNIREGEIGDEYYGKGDVYNKGKGHGDGRNAQLRISGGSGPQSPKESSVWDIESNSNASASTNNTGGYSNQNNAKKKGGNTRKKIENYSGGLM